MVVPGTIPSRRRASTSGGESRQDWWMERLPTRAAFPVLRSLQTRWLDNDHYGHVNNVVYYSYFDTAVNGWLIEASGRDIRELAAIGVVAETSCRFLKPVGFPDPLEVGLAVERLGRTSVSYRLAVFRATEEDASAIGRFVHVYVDREARRPVVIPVELRAVLEPVRESTARLFARAGLGDAPEEA
jgi:acyl-CoA thioester hydrolase